MILRPRQIIALAIDVYVLSYFLKKAYHRAGKISRDLQH